MQESWSLAQLFWFPLLTEAWGRGQARVELSQGFGGSWG